METSISDPTFISVLADQDGFARWVGRINTHDIMQASDHQGIHLLIILGEDGTIQVATKPGDGWEATWSPPVEVERR